MRESFLQGILAAVVVLFSGCAIGPPTDTPPPTLPATSFVSPDTVGGLADRTYDFEPEVISMEEPQYPEKAREAGVQGTVLCSAYVDATGRVIKVRVGSGVDRALDEAAMRAVRTAVFKPARRKDGSTVATWMVVPIEFKLH